MLIIYLISISYELIFKFDQKNLNLILKDIILKIINEKTNNNTENINETKENIKDNKFIINRVIFNNIFLSLIKIILYYSVYEKDIKSIELILNNYGQYFITELIILSIKLNFKISTELLSILKESPKDPIEEILLNIYLNKEKIKQGDEEIIYNISQKLIDFNLKKWIEKIYLFPSNLIDIHLQDLRIFFINLLTLNFNDYILNEEWDKIKINISNNTFSLIEKILYKINEELI